jgi:hypothetical protein
MTSVVSRSVRTRHRIRAICLALVGAVASVLIVVSAGTTTVSPEPPAAVGPTEFLSFGHDVYDFVPGSSKTIGGVTIRLTESADFQVVDRGGAILWHTRTNASCRDDCRVVLQSDGNLVLSAGEAALWSSGTYQSPSATLIVQPKQPYLTIRNAAYDVVWTSNGDNAAGATAMLNGALVAPRADAVQDFLDSLGVNSHMDQYERDPTEVLRKLDYLGVRSIRDHWTEDGSLRDEYTYLARNGIRFDMVHYSSDFDVLLRDAGIMAALPNDPLIAVEGPNEINNFPFTCGGSRWSGGLNNDNGPAAECFMRTYYSRTKQDPRLADVPVYDLTGATSVTDPDKYGLLTLTDRADLGNIHPYAAPTDQPRDVLLRSLGSQYLSVLPNQAVITETGYETATVSERAQALYIMNLYLDAFQAGFRKTYVYELTDNDRETFGFFGRNNQPKASATAMHNLTSMLADAGPPRDGVLNHSVEGLPQEARSIAMQRSTGAFNMVLWNERPVWNGGDLAVPATPVTVSFDRTFSKVSVFHPLQSATAVDQQGPTSSVQLTLSGEPVVLELVP